MNDLLRRLLGLEQVRLTDSPLTVEFGQPPAPWAMLAGAVMVVVLVALVYRFEHGPGWLRLMLATARACILLAVLGLMAFPNLVLTRERVEPSVVAVLLDQSASMAEPDGLASALKPPASGPAQAETAAASQPTRWQEAVALTGRAQSGVIEALRARHRVELWTFDGSARRLTRDATVGDVAPLASAAPDGRASHVSQALGEVLARTHGSRVAALLLLSDGRQAGAAATDELIAEARRRRVEIDAIAFGSPQPRLDVEVEPPQTNEDVFRKDIAAIRARLRTQGLDAGAEVAVELTERATSRVVERRVVRVGEAAASGPAAPEQIARARDGLIETEFRFRPDAAGRLDLRITATPLPGETVIENNHADVTLRVHDDKLRVLYVDGPPRFEYRFLKNALLREPTLASSCLLLDATAAFVQEGTDPIRAFPISPGELSAYDVILLGDVDPRGDWISPAQLSMIVDFVAERGGGIGFIAGERSMPHALAGTPLAPLLPVRLSPQSGAAHAARLTRGFLPVPTDAGRAHPLLRLEVDPAENARVFESLPEWFWCAPSAGPAPAAEVLATASHGSPDGDDAVPLIVAGRYGAGRTLYIGSDDVWRWRRYQGEAYYDTFWLNALRTLAGARQRGSAGRWRLETDRQTYELEQPIAWRLTRAPGAEGVSPATIPLEIRDAAGRTLTVLSMQRGAAADETYSASYWAGAPGSYTAMPQLPQSDPAEAPRRTVSVMDASHERRDTASDPGYLRKLASATGGHVWTAAEWPAAAAAIPDNSLRVADDLTEPLWDSWAALIACAGLLTFEWLVRKLRGMS